VVGRVARWYNFKHKISIWVNFRGSCNGTSLCILWPFGIILQLFGMFYGHLVFLAYFPPFWNVVSRKSGNPGGWAKLVNGKLFNVTNNTYAGSYVIQR
jgi:hypothetical protein